MSKYQSLEPLEQFEIFRLLNSDIPLNLFSQVIFPYYFTNLHIEWYLILAFLVGILTMEVHEIKTPLFNYVYLIIFKSYQFVYGLIVQNLTNSTKTNDYLPLFFIIFLLVLMCNLLGIFPYHFTLTSHFSITFGLSLSLFIGFNVTAIKKYALKTFNLFLPQGIPLLLAPLLVFIETMSYLARVISLATRLFANIISGHTLIKILSNFSFTLLQKKELHLILLGVLPLIVILAVIGLEFTIAFLQAYVFITLLSIYLNDVLYIH